jgi:hypothetical protein
MHYYVSPLLLALFFALPATAETFTLSCHALVGGVLPVDKIVVVDATASTINGVPGHITEGELRWVEAKPDESVHSMTVNRYSGKLFVAVREKGWEKGLTNVSRDGSVDEVLARLPVSSTFTGDCTLATKKKF